MVRVQVEAVGLEQISMSPVVILADEERRTFLPLLIGQAEATAIGLELEETQSPRPLTHDLLHSIVKAVHATVSKVVITEMREETYYAVVYVQIGDRTEEIDARPSDSIALALRSGAPIYVAQQVAAECMVPGPIEDPEMEDFREFLSDLSPEDFRRDSFE